MKLLRAVKKPNRMKLEKINIHGRWMDGMMSHLMSCMKIDAVVEE
jgi:hypothetical protein